MKSTMFKGIFPALVTPYGGNGNVNYEEIDRLVRHLSKSDISGFYLCGSTAEAFLLSHDERKKIVETVVNANEENKKLIVHVGDIGVDLSLDLARHAASLNVDAISSVAPFYFKFSENEIYEYYKALNDDVDLPLVLYNFPTNSGVALSYGFFEKLNSLRNVVGLKHTSSDYFLLERIKYKHPEISVFNGYDEMMLSGLVAGADGAIGSTFNCIAPVICEIYNAFNARDLERARYLQHRANDLIAEIVNGGTMQSIKAILETEGFKMNGCRKPFGPISEKAKKSLLDTYRALKKEFHF